MIIDVNGHVTTTKGGTVPAPEALISIGSATDAALDYLRISDQIIPRLRAMTTTFRSSRWVSVLESSEFGHLSRENATILAAALLSDIKHAKTLPKVRDSNLHCTRTI